MMAEQERGWADYDAVLAELEQLVRLGLVSVNPDMTLNVTEAGAAALHEANAQTWC
jgi:hypothetical protein